MPCALFVLLTLEAAKSLYLAHKVELLLLGYVLLLKPLVFCQLFVSNRGHLRIHGQLVHHLHVV